MISPKATLLGPNIWASAGNLFHQFRTAKQRHVAPHPVSGEKPFELASVGLVSVRLPWCYV